MQCIRPSIRTSFLIRVSILLLVCGTQVSNLSAQLKAFQEKLSPGLLHRADAVHSSEVKLFTIAIRGKELPVSIDKSKFNVSSKGSFGNFSMFDITASYHDLLTIILPVDKVIFIEDGTRVPREELIVGSLDLSANKINKAHRHFPQWNGNGLVVSVKENKPDTTDIDFAGRFLTTHLASSVMTTHASIMATMIAGAGNSWHLGKGAAWGGTISSSSFANLLPESNAAYQQYGISVQNHSYGVGVENYYGADAAAYDASAIDNPGLLHVFSSGNAGAGAATSGVYVGIPGFANLTGSFKMAKNILTVGATDSFGIVSPLSSKGPAHDGRVKPDLVAFGEDGSSGAAALVSGTALLIQHAYRQLTGSLPANALTRSILLTSADDAGNKELDYSNGYGTLNAYKALQIVQGGSCFIGTVSNSNSQVFSISVPAGIRKIKATLVWNDLPAMPNTTRALVNDLDLELVHVQSGQNWKPWVLNKYPHIDSLQQLATRKKDSLNTAEQVTLDNPAAGDYQLRVTGFSVTSPSQVFYITYQLDSLEKFEWQYPTQNDFIFSSASNTLRWSSSFTTTTGKIESSIDNGNSWQLVDNTVDLSKGYYRWNTGLAITTALLKMTVGTNQFLSDTFTISTRTLTGVGFNCPDSFLIYWNRIPGITTYRVYKLGSRYLEPLLVTTDSFVVLAKNLHPSLHYAVAPVILNREGVKSYTFNYTTQGVECYLRSFLASLQNNSTAQLDLSLGTTYNINRIVLEKFDGTNFIALQQLTTLPGVNIRFIDNQLSQGLNIYRIRIELANGQVIYTDQQTVNYLPAGDFIVYPNPVEQGRTVNVLAADLLQFTRLQVLNGEGQKIYETVLVDINTEIPTGRFGKGLYFFRFIKEDGYQKTFKVFIR